MLLYISSCILYHEGLCQDVITLHTLATVHHAHKFAVLGLCSPLALLPAATKHACA